MARGVASIAGVVAFGVCLGLCTTTVASTNTAERLRAREPIDRQQHPFSAEAAWTALGKGRPRLSVGIPGDLAARYGMQFANGPGEWQSVVLKHPTTTENELSGLYLGLEIYPAVGEARQRTQERLFGPKGWAPLVPPDAVQDQGFAYYQENMGILRLLFVTDNVVGEASGVSSETVLALVTEVSGLIRAASSAGEGRARFVVTSESVGDTGSLRPQCSFTARPTDYLKSQGREPLVEIVSPENGSWAPVSVREMVVRGRVNDPRIAFVRLNEKVVPVTSGGFETRVESHDSPTWIRVEVPREVAAPEVMGATDAITVCQQGR